MKINSKIFESRGSNAIVLLKSSGEDVLIYNWEGGKGNQVMACQVSSEEMWEVSEPDIDTIDLTAVVCRNDILVVWNQLTEGKYQLFESVLSKGGVKKITDCNFPVINPVLAADPKGEAYLAYQTSDNNGCYNIYLRRRVADTWSDPVLISDLPGNNWCADMVCCTDGKIAIAWDGYAGGNYDIYVRFIDHTFTLMPILRLTDDQCFHSNASLSPTPDGGVWIAWNRGIANWGKDNEVYRTTRIADRNYLHTRRFIEARKVYPEEVYPVYPPIQDILDSKLPGMLHERPRLYSSPNGLQYLSFRYNEGDAKKGSRTEKRWQAMVTCYNGKHWSDSVELIEAHGLSTGRISIAGDAQGKVFAAVSGESGLGRTEDLETMVKLYLLEEVPEREEFKQSPVKGRFYPVLHPKQRSMRHSIKYQQEDYPLYFGDLHRHSELSFCRTSIEGSIEEVYRYAKDAAELDFISTTDHDFHMQADAMWAQSTKNADKHYIPGYFTTFFGYEWMGGGNKRHRNIISSVRVPVPPFNTVDGERYIRDTWNTLQRNKAITIPHHTGCHMGLQWGKDPGEASDPVYEPLVEIFQASRSSSEYPGCPTLCNSFYQLGFTEKEYRNTDGFVDAALKKNIRMGFIACSDHLSTHSSYACVYAQENTREALMKAMIARHVYAATDRIICEFSINGAIMGDEIELGPDAALNVYIRFVGTGKIKEIALLCDSVLYKVWYPKGSEAEVMFTLGAEEAKGHYYYSRMIQEDSHLAWSSPIWIN